MRYWPAHQGPWLRLGTYGPLFLKRSFVLDSQQLATHRHLIGVSGVGKSKLLESIFLQLFSQGIGVSFLDPHSDSAESILATLTASGYFRQPDAYKRLLYISLSDDDHALPFNVLHQPQTRPHTLASNILEAFHRAWPALGEGAAPQFDNLVLAGALVLIENRLPLPVLHRLLTDKPFRDGLLRNLAGQDQDIAAFFTDRFDRWSRGEAPQMIESTLRRLFLLTFSPVLKHSLGQSENVLNFRRIMDEGTSVIFNIGGVHDQDARRLLGCLITIGYETAALSRTDVLPDDRRMHHLLLDEFSDYSAQSEEALSRALSLTRKFGLFMTMAHQTWSQASERLQGALQNVGVRIAMRVGRSDAELLARQLGRVELERVKHEVTDPTQLERTHPLFAPLSEQWEELVQTLTELPQRQALVKVTGKKTAQLKTPTMAPAKCSPEVLALVKQRYAELLTAPREGRASPSQEPLAWPREHTLFRRVRIRQRI